MTKIYFINPSYTLHQVYLAWLIALDTRRFESDNNLNSGQLIAFRNNNRFTWSDFEAERQRVSNSGLDTAGDK